MRYLILSDIHANLDAFDAVLTHAEGTMGPRARARRPGRLRRAQPGVVDRVKELAPDAVIRGNHDKAACGIDDGSQFNHVARMAAVWTGAQLTPENLTYLRELPMGPVLIDDLTEICHGAPFDEDHYIFDGNDARMAFDTAERPLCLYGHTHLPAIFRRIDDHYEGGAPDPDREVVVPLQRGVQYLVNVGSIGQPRDGDPRSGYGVLDADARELRLYRVPYSVGDAQQKIIAAGLPVSLANRLALGR